MKKQEKGITLIALIITIVVLIILAMVSIGAVRDGGIITHAERAANQMNKAQIEEKANLTKLEYTAEALMNNELKMSKQEFRDALRKAFEIPDDMDTNNDDIVEVNDKYAVIIKNTALDVEVVELANAPRADFPIAITYTVNDQKEENNVIYTSFDITIRLLRENLEASKNLTMQQKEAAVVSALGKVFDTSFTDLDDAIVKIVNSEFGTSFGNIDSCLSGLSQQAGTTIERGHLYYAFYYNENLNPANSMGQVEFINSAYAMLYPSNNYSTQYKIYMKVGEQPEKLIGPVDFDDQNPITFNTKDVAGWIGENSIYELIIKNTSEVEVAREKVEVRNIVKSPSSLSKEDAKGIWTTNGTGTITAYAGKDTSVTIPKMIGTEVITTIGSEAFREKKSVTSVTIPDTVTSLEYGAFIDCSNLTDITIPANVDTIGNQVFDSCSSLKNLIISEGVKNIGRYAFNKCTSLESITIPSTASSTGWLAFAGCTNLKSVIISEGVGTIEDNSFWGCTSLTEVKIPNSVTGIGEEAFDGCTSLASITIPNTVTTIGEWAFASCESLTEIIIPDKVTTINKALFYNCKNLTNVQLPSNIVSIGERTFEGCTSLTSVTMPDTVTTIGKQIFKNCKALTNVKLSNNISSIPKEAFIYCSSLERVTIPSGVTLIGEAAFRECTVLAEIIIPENVKKIETYAFTHCKNLTSIIIPANTTSIGSMTFYGCENLTNIYHKADTAPSGSPWSAPNATVSKYNG